MKRIHLLFALLGLALPVSTPAQGDAAYVSDLTEIVLRYPPSVSPEHPNGGVGSFDVSLTGNTLVYESWATGRLPNINFWSSESHLYLADLRYGSPTPPFALRWIGFRPEPQLPHEVVTRGMESTPRVSGNGMFWVYLSGDPLMDGSGRKNSNVTEVWYEKRPSTWPELVQPTIPIYMVPGYTLPNPQRVPTMDGADPNGASYDPEMDGGGRYIVFVSQASNFVVGDTNETSDVFRFDRVFRRIERVNTHPNGAECAEGSVNAPQISAKGDRVAFAYNGSDLVNNPNGYGTVLVKDMRTGSLLVASSTSGGQLADGYSGSPRISPDGRYVLFNSLATNLVPGVNPSGTESYLYLKDLQTGAVECVSRGGNGTPMASTEGDVSNNAEWVLFTAVPPGDWQTYAYAVHRPTSSFYVASAYNYTPFMGPAGRHVFPAWSPRISGDGLTWFWLSHERMIDPFSGSPRTPFTFHQNVFQSGPFDTTPDLEPDVFTTAHDASRQLAEEDGVFANDTFPSGRPPVGMITSLPTNGVLNRPLNDRFDAGTDELVYTPNAGFVGTDSFTYACQDGPFRSRAVSVTIHVRAPGDRDLTSLTVNPPGVVGGDSATGTVLLDGPAPVGGTIVNLSVGNPTLGSVPPTVTVPAGQASADFTVATNPTSGDHNLIVTAERNGIEKKARLTIGPDVLPKLADFTVFPRVGLGGSIRTATIELTMPAPAGGALVTLSTSNSLATVPASVSVPEGQFYHTFTFPTVPVETEGNCDVTADYNRTVTRRITINPGPVIGGTLALFDFVGDPTGLPVRVALREPGGTTEYAVYDTALDASASFEIRTHLQGVYDVVVKCAHWLGTRVANIEVRNANVTSLVWSCQNGDVNLDNRVNILDFLALRAAFGSAPGSPNWNPNADCDGNGSVNAADFVSLRNNFGATGE